MTTYIDLQLLELSISMTGSDAQTKKENPLQKVTKKILPKMIKWKMKMILILKMNLTL